MKLLSKLEPLRVRVLASILFLACGITGLTGCFPGGMFVPAPLSHIDRPTIRGVLFDDGRPARYQRIGALSYSSRLLVSCADMQSSAETNHMGEFEIPGDRDRMTLMWGSGPNGLAICLPDSGDLELWRTPLTRAELPPFLPEQIEVVCHISPESPLHCISSLVDELMVDCSDDLDYEFPVGWLDAKTRMPYSGRCVSHYDNGQLLERADFVAGIRIGPWISFDERGIRDHQSFWIDGRRRRETVWHRNGTMFRQTHYRATADERGLAVRHGLNTVWTENGSIELQQCWVDGLQKKLPAEECHFD